MFENSAEYRLAARAFLKGRWQNAMLVTFFSTVITTAMSVVMTFISPALYEQLTSLLYMEITMEELVGNVLSACAIPLKVMAALMILELLVGEVLALGRLSFFENIVQGKTAAFRDLFSRFRIFGKSILLRVLMYVKILLWALPGMALYAGLLLLLSTKQVNSADDINFLLSLVSILEFIGIGAVTVPAIIAYFRYCMAPYMMAQIPSAGAMDCIRKSRELMNGKKKFYFLLLLGFMGWLLAVELMSSFLSGISYPLYVVAYLFASLALDAYMEMTKTVFYVRLTGQLVMRRVTSEQDINDIDEGE